VPRADNLATIMCRLAINSGILNLLKLSDRVQPYIETALRPFPSIQPYKLESRVKRYAVCSSYDKVIYSVKRNMYTIINT
jgi:hypothetical protein